MLCFYCVFIIFTFYLIVHLSLLSFYCFYGFKFLFTFLALLSKHFVNSVFKKYYINDVYYYYYYLFRLGAAVCQRSAVLLWLQLWGQTPLISENWIWVTTTCRTQQWRSCVVFYRVQPVDWRLWGQFTDFCRSHIYQTAFIPNWSHLILI